MYVSKLVLKYADQGHPLGKPVYPAEVASLVADLFVRLHVSEKVLDSSLESLPKLDRILVDYANSLEDADWSALDGDNLVKFIRELTAYLVQVLLVSAQGEWNNDSRSLFSTHVSVKGPWKSKKEGKITTPDEVVFVPGGEAVLAWESILDGEKPKLSRLKSKIKRKYIKDV